MLPFDLLWTMRYEWCDNRHIELGVLRAKAKFTMSSFLALVIMEGYAKMKTPSAWVSE